jgi:hypothetical protein
MPTSWYACRCRSVAFVHPLLAFIHVVAKPLLFLALRHDIIPWRWFFCNPSVRCFLEHVLLRLYKFVWLRFVVSPKDWWWIACHRNVAEFIVIYLVYSWYIINLFKAMMQWCWFLGSGRWGDEIFQVSDCRCFAPACFPRVT